jgi:hypothetical protein
MVSGQRLRAWLPTALCLAVLGPSGTALAYRPFDSTDAAVAKPLELEIEMGPLDYLVVGQTSFFIVPNLVVNLGFAPGWEAVVQGQQIVQLGPTGGQSRYSIANTQLLVKGVLRDGCLQDSPGPSVALETGLLLPTLNSDQGLGGILTVILSQRVGPATFSFDGTVLVTHTGNVGWEGGLIIEGPSSWAIRPVAELLAAHEASVGTELSLLLGAIWQFGEDFSLDAAIRGGRLGGSAVGEFRAGFTWTIPL